jgi:hypothetical protein
MDGLWNQQESEVINIQGSGMKNIGWRIYENTDLF